MVYRPPDLFWAGKILTMMATPIDDPPIAAAKTIQRMQGMFYLDLIMMSC
jgi:hypothetical protein